jgi:hypothetical protein
MMVKASSPIWESVPLLEFVQFPWRFLLLVYVGLMFLIGGTGAAVEQWRASRPVQLVARVAVVCAVVLTSIWTLGQITPRHLDHSLLTKEYLLHNVVTTSLVHEYTPKTVLTPPGPRKKDYFFVEGQGKVVAQERSSGHLAAIFETAAEARIRVSQFYFPGWQIYVNGERLHPLSFDRFGAMQVSLPAGRTKVTLVYEGSGLQRQAVWASWAALVLALLFAFVVGPRREYLLAR